MKNTEIKNIFFRNNGVSALYQGINLIWKKESEEQDPDNYIPKYNFSGKFTDDSTEADWKCDSLNLADKVNPETKIFDFEISSINTNTLFRNYTSSLGKLEYIYSLPPSSSNSYNFEATFSGQNRLKGKISIPNENFKLNTSTYFNATFQMCNELNTIEMDLTDINVRYFGDLFYNCGVETIILKNFNCANNTNSNYFYYAHKLKNIIGPIYNIKTNQDLHNAVELTNNSAMVLISGLTEEIEGTKNITFSSSTYDTLTEEQIALATSKGWSVVRS